MKIAVTGTIGSGKSTVAQLIIDLVAVKHIDTDEVCRLLLLPGEEGYCKIVETWSETYIAKETGQLDRKKLREAVFNNDSVRTDLEEILHPLVFEYIEKESAALSSDTIMVVEVPLLFEKGWQRQFDRSLLVVAEDPVCLQRIVARDGCSVEQAEKIMSSQMKVEQKKKLADYIINNSGSIANTEKQVKLFIEDIKNNYSLI